MKPLLLIECLLLVVQINTTAFSQPNTTFIKAGATKSLDDLDIITCGITCYPQYPGGDKAIRKFFAQNLRYPKTAQKEGIIGKSIVQFAIDTFGNPINISIIKGSRDDFNKEAIRVISLLKGWQFSAEAHGKKRMAYHIQPFTFKIPKADISEETKNKKKPRICK